MVDSLEQIRAIETLRARAILEGDVATLDEITGDDYVHVDGNGRLRNKQEFLSTLSQAQARYTRYEISDSVIAVHGEVAVVTGQFQNEHITPSGTTIAKTGRHLRVYVRRPTGWSNIAHQGTEIKQ